MTSLIIINSGPNLSAWERKVERTKALSHTAETSYRKRKDIRFQSNHPHKSQSNSPPSDRSSASPPSTVGATNSTQLVSRRTTRPNAFAHPGHQLVPPPNIFPPHPSPLVTIQDDEKMEDDVWQILQQARMEQFISQNIFSIDFGCFRGMRTEPFGVISELAAPAVDYYSQVVVPSFSAVWKIFDVNSMVPQAFFEFFDTKVCLMAMVLPPRVITDGSWYPGKPMPEVFLRGYNLALSRLRQQITDLGGKADASTLVAVNSLAILAGAMGDMESFKVHTRSLTHLVKSAGGFENLGRFHFIKSLLLQWESQWAYNPSMRVSLYPDARAKYVAYFPSPPFSPQVKELIVKLPIGFRRLAQRELLSLRTLEILARCADVSAGRMPLNDDSRDQFHPEERRFADFFEACPCIVPGAEDPPPLEKFVVQALILYCHNTWSPLRFNWALYKATRMNLTMDLLGRPLTGEHEREIMTWIYMNLIDSWQVVEGTGRLTPEGKGVFIQLEDLFSGTINNEDVKQIMQQLELFFWTDRFKIRCGRCLGVASTERQCRSPT